ncbi:TPA: alpha-1,2-fucosyltransferase [Streptococcus suis]
MKKIVTNIQGTRFGNHLYFYLFANKEKDILIEYVEDMDYWNQYFPRLNKFVTKENSQGHIAIQPNRTFFQAYGQDFSEEDLQVFIDECLKEDVLKLLESKDFSFDCVINIRRGDFYSDEYKYYYGFDQISYLENCLSQTNLTVNDRIAVISDDIDWCMENLTFIKEKFNRIEFLRLSPLNAFLHCIKAKQLIISNSTFSYWAAYINCYLDKSHIIFAPNYNTQKMKKGAQIAASEDWILVPVKPYRSLIFESKQKLRHKLREVRKVLRGLYSTVYEKRKK